MLAWLFWGIAEVVSWKFHSPSSNTRVVLLIKFIHFSVAALYNLIAVWGILFIRKHVIRKTLRMCGFALVIALFSILAVLTNSTLYNIILNNPRLFLELPNLALNTLQKIIYFTGFTTLFFMIRNLKELREQKQMTLEAQHLATQSQLQLLRQQMNPHFLFNALNSLRNLIANDTHKARNMVTQLSELLRESLQSNEREEHSLREELMLLKNYLLIQQARFGNDLKVHYQIAPECLAQPIPSFSLQPLAENAIKHGIKTGVQLQLTISGEIKENTLTITVSNNGTLAVNSNSGHGLSNLQKRLEILYPKRAQFVLSQVNGQVQASIHIKNNLP